MEQIVWKMVYTHLSIRFTNWSVERLSCSMMMMISYISSHSSFLHFLNFFIFWSFSNPCEHFLLTIYLYASLVAVNEITQDKVAIKILNKRKIKMQGVFEKVKREIKVLRRFNHPHIIKHFEFIDTSSDIFIVLEYAEKGELFDLIQRKEKVGSIWSGHIQILTLTT